MASSWVVIGFIAGFGFGVIWTVHTVRREMLKRIARMEAGNEA